MVAPRKEPPFSKHVKNRIGYYDLERKKSQDKLDEMILFMKYRPNDTQRLQAIILEEERLLKEKFRKEKGEQIKLSSILNTALVMKLEKHIPKTEEG